MWENNSCAPWIKQCQEHKNVLNICLLLLTYLLISLHWKKCSQQKRETCYVSHIKKKKIDLLHSILFNTCPLQQNFIKDLFVFCVSWATTPPIPWTGLCPSPSPSTDTVLSQCGSRDLDAAKSGDQFSVPPHVTCLFIPLVTFGHSLLLKHFTTWVPGTPLTLGAPWTSLFHLHSFLESDFSQS